MTTLKDRIEARRAKVAEIEAGNMSGGYPPADAFRRDFGVMRLALERFRDDMAKDPLFRELFGKPVPGWRVNRIWTVPNRDAHSINLEGNGSHLEVRVTSGIHGDNTSKPTTSASLKFDGQGSYVTERQDLGSPLDLDGLQAALKSMVVDHLETLLETGVIQEPKEKSALSSFFEAVGERVGLR